jgi:predicted metal-binding protein
MRPKGSKGKPPDKALHEMLAFLKKKGASEAIVIPAGDIIVDERVRLKCQIPLCDSFGRNLMCPPFLPSVAQFREALARYEQAVLIQVRASLKQTKGDPYLPARQLHRIVNMGEKYAFESGLRFALGLIGGCCRLCDTCVAADSARACRHPFKARPSMEAMGIDVQATAEKAGVPFVFPVRDEVIWTGLILL